VPSYPFHPELGSKIAATTGKSRISKELGKMMKREVKTV